MPGSGSGTATDPSLAAGLSKPQAYPHPADDVELVETHISQVFLAGEYAYKFKKALDLGFLDFRAPEKRLHFCREELRLNRRLAPEIYLDLAGAWQEDGAWRVGPWRKGAEPAVRMRRFPDDARLDRQLARGRLSAAALEAFAIELARFQQALPPASPGSGLGDARAAAAPALANFAAIDNKDLSPEATATLARLACWTRERAGALAPVFDDRLAAGFVREGHGDLHLGNLVMLGDRIVPFDGIEFDPALRWIDIQSEVAFLLMDLESRDQSELGWGFYNAWLAALGDYEGLAVLRWYLAYRHLVRAKIDGIRRSQSGVEPGEARRLAERQAAHIRFACDHADPPAPLLLLMHGYSGSGKSRLARRLAAALPAVWVRSDVERKRVHGLSPSVAAPAAVGKDLYDEASSARTYARLAEITQTGLAAGCNVIVDAAFLDHDRREEFLRLALACGARPVVLACTAPAEVLRQRVAARREDPSDAGVDVLEAQLARPSRHTEFEVPYRLAVDTSEDPALAPLLAALSARQS